MSKTKIILVNLENRKHENDYLELSNAMFTKQCCIVDYISKLPSDIPYYFNGCEPDTKLIMIIGLKTKEKLMDIISIASKPILVNNKNQELFKIEPEAVYVDISGIDFGSLKNNLL